MTDWANVSWNGEALTKSKLDQMVNNDQYLFERLPRMRYSGNGLVRDTGLKIIAGKTPYVAQQVQFVYLQISFGSFFTAGCKPVVTATAEAVNGGHRNRVTMWGLNQQEIDNTGFQAIVSEETTPTLYPGWVHWIAVGY